MILNEPFVSSAQLPALRVGGVYPARVVGRLAGGRVNLQLEGRSIPARTATPVSMGEGLQVEVLAIVPELVLRVVGRERHV